MDRHYVLVVSGLRDQVTEAEMWVDVMNRAGKRYRRITWAGVRDLSRRRNGFEDGDVIYILTHGNYNAETDIATGTIEMDGDKGQADKLAKKIAACQVPKDAAIKLKIFACLSADEPELNSKSYAQQLRVELCKRGYHRMIVYGYRGETKALAWGQHKAAGVALHSPMGTEQPEPDDTLETWRYHASHPDNRTEHRCGNDRQCPHTGDKMGGLSKAPRRQKSVGFNPY